MRFLRPTATELRAWQPRVLKDAAVVCALASGAFSLDAAAQCPDGTPPPCRIAANTPARRDPPLDERTWLVLPFTNTARNAEAELIGAASVNLLYQELSRFTDIHVISDDHVADLVRRGAPALGDRIGLATGLDLARRSGAGRLVLGSYLAAGTRAQLTATLYDVRSGREQRTVRDQTSEFTAARALDSLTAVFDRIAHGLLELRPPGRVSQPGTRSLEAFRAFLDGMAQIRESRFDSARVLLERAVTLDSNYAWARYRLYWVRSWLGDDRASIRVHLDAAARLAAELPPRERALIRGSIALFGSQAEAICASADEVQRSDSTDVEGWHLRYHCLLGAARVERNTVDSTLTVHTNPTAALRALERALSHDPSHSESFADLVGSLQQRSFYACLGAAPDRCPPERLVFAVFLGSADSVVVLARMARDVGARPQDAPDVLEAWRLRLDRAIAAASRYAAANPGSWRAHGALAGLLMTRGGSLSQAQRELDAAAYGLRLFSWRRPLIRDHVEVLLRRELADSARRWVDSLAADPRGRMVQTWYFTVFGRFSLDVQLPADSVRLRQIHAAWRPVLAGVLPENFDRIEQEFVASHPESVRRAAQDISTLVAFRMRGRGPALDTAAAHPLCRAQAFLAAGDSVRARRELLGFDAQLASRPAFAVDDAGWLLAAELFVALGDSAAALARLADWATRWPTLSHLHGVILDQTEMNSTVRLAPRSWLLFGDLSLAAGRRDDARRAYRMVLGMWEGGEAPVQPIAARVRAALAQLGG